MGLTPLDVENTRFRGALGGYNRTEVEQFQLRVSQALEAQLEEIRNLQQRISSLEEEVGRYKESEELLRNSVMLAQKTCDDLIAAARKKAELIQDEALAEGDMLKQQFAQLRSQREQFEYAFHGLLTGFINRLEQGNPALTGSEPAAGRKLPGGGSHQQPPEPSTAPRDAAADQSPLYAPPAPEEAGLTDDLDEAVESSGDNSRTVPVSNPETERSDDLDSDSEAFSAAIAEAASGGVDWPGEEQPELRESGRLEGTDIITALINRNTDRNEHTAATDAADRSEGEEQSVEDSAETDAGL